MDITHQVELVGLTNSVGWLIAMQVAKDKLEALEKAAFDCEDEAKVGRLVKDAKAARAFWESFVATIENKKNPNEAEQFGIVEVL